MAAAVRIIGIDPGLRRTGWGIIESEGHKLVYLASGTVISDDKCYLAERLQQLFAGLRQAVDEWAPVEAAAEKTFVNRNASATLKLGHARGIALVVPALAGICVFEYAPNMVKKSVVGAGHADKAQIRVMVEHLLPRARPDSEDASDALAVAITHAHHRKHSAMIAMLTAGEVAAP